MLDHYFEIVDEHFERRHEVEHYIRHLDKQAQQIRVVQKRLLARFKDKTPAPLDHLDQLLEASFDALLELTDVLTDAETRLRNAADVLAAATRTLLLLVRLRFRLDAAQFSVLEAALDAETVHATEDGWEVRCMDDGRWSMERVGVWMEGAGHIVALSDTMLIRMFY